jgi:DnaA family protein
MKQLVLDVHLDCPPMFDNFIVGANGELLATLRRLACAPAALPAPHLYLWGPDGSGRSHLLGATVACARAHGRPAFAFTATDIATDLPEDPQALIAIDDADTLPPPAQIVLFNAFNHAPRNDQTLLLAGSAPPVHLALREDLRTRISQHLVFEVNPLDDASRAAILRSLAARRGLTLSNEIIDFMLNHGHRDLPHMVAIFEALDAASLEHKRPVTLPLLRELVQQGLRL